jgi:hypothetical protein
MTRFRMPTDHDRWLTAVRHRDAVFGRNGWAKVSRAAIDGSGGQRGVLFYEESTRRTTDASQPTQGSMPPTADPGVFGTAGLMFRRETLTLSSPRLFAEVTADNVAR